MSSGLSAATAGEGARVGDCIGDASASTEGSAGLPQPAGRQLGDSSGAEQAGRPRMPACAVALLVPIAASADARWRATSRLDAAILVAPAAEEEACVASNALEAREGSGRPKAARMLASVNLAVCRRSASF